MEDSMKALIGSLVALGMVAAPALAAAPKSTTKTVKVKGADETATTTVTTKIAPSSKTTHHAKAKKMTTHKSASASVKKAPSKTAAKAKG
jgi:hypothetical protein